jgi:exosortase/archaeosortase family protein
MIFNPNRLSKIKIFDLIKSNNFFYLLLNLTIFTLLILSFHFLFRWWDNENYWPILPAVEFAYEQLSILLFENSIWVLKQLTFYEFYVKSEARQIWMVDGCVEISHYCSALKQILQWIFLMILFPGPWKHKLWFIPIGVIALHIINIFRIVFLFILLFHFPEYWDLAHDYVPRPFFYGLIFGMWVIWVERFQNIKTK